MNAPQLPKDNTRLPKIVSVSTNALPKSVVTTDFFGFDKHRILPAGPTFIDMMANAALYLGLVEHVVMNAMDERSPLPFAAARANFYAAARDGLRARLDCERQRSGLPVHQWDA